MLSTSPAGCVCHDECGVSFFDSRCSYIQHFGLE